MITIRRVYDKGLPGEKYRILVDRLWPRGISKENAPWDLWLKDIAPSNELRKWYHYDSGPWDEFKARYNKELERNTDDSKKLLSMEKKYGRITLLYSSKNVLKNNAVVLKSYLENNHDESEIPQ